MRNHETVWPAIQMGYILFVRTVHCKLPRKISAEIVGDGFRGPNGTGIAQNTGALPVTWSNESETSFGRLLLLVARVVRLLSMT